MPRAQNGRNRPRIPVNIVYRTIQATRGPTATAKLLRVSLPTLSRWRREGRVPDAAAVLTWAAHLYPHDAAAAYQLACRLAGLAPRRKVR